MKKTTKSTNVCEFLNSDEQFKLLSLIHSELGIIPANVFFDYEMYQEMLICCGGPGSHRDIQRITLFDYYLYLEIFYTACSASKADTFAFVWPA